MPILGRLSDRYGRRPMLLFSLWGTVVSFAMMGLTHSIFWLLVARIIDGISGGNISIASAYIADITDKKGRAGGMGILAAGISLGFIFGPLWGGLFSKISPAAPFIAATILTLVSVLLTQFFLPESVSTQEITYEKKHFNLTKFWLHVTEPTMLILYLTSLFLFWAQSGVFTTISLFGKDILGMSVGQTSLLFAFGMTIFSIGNSFLMPVVQATVSEKSSPHEQGGNLGVMQSFGSIGRIFGPIAAGYIYEKVSPFSPSLMGAIIMLLILGFGIKLQKQIN